MVTVPFERPAAGLMASSTSASTPAGAPSAAVVPSGTSLARLSELSLEHTGCTGVLLFEDQR